MNSDDAWENDYKAYEDDFSQEEIQLQWSMQLETRNSAVSEIPLDALCHVKSGLGVAQGHWKIVAMSRADTSSY